MPILDTSAHDVDTQQHCIRESIKAGLKTSAISLAISSAVILGISRFSPAFRKSLSVSSKTALIIMPPFGLFFVDSDLEMQACSKRRRDMIKANQDARTGC
jgi:hypothetical protein